MVFWASETASVVYYFVATIFYVACTHLVTDTTGRLQDVYPFLIQCWPTVFDAGPTLNQHRVNLSCVLGYHITLLYLQSQRSPFLPYPLEQEVNFQSLEAVDLCGEAQLQATENLKSCIAREMLTL